MWQSVPESTPGCAWVRKRALASARVGGFDWGRILDAQQDEMASGGRARRVYCSDRSPTASASLHPSPPEWGDSRVPETILQRVAAGQADAVQECIDQYSNLVWSLARRFTRSADDAEDAVQDIFLDLWKSAARFDPSKASETTFVAMVARRRLIDQLRRTESRPQLVGMPEHFDPPDEEHQRLEIGIEARSAARALAALKPEQRRVLMMSIYEGRSHGEIVEATGMPLGTVKSHIRRGLAEVRARLDAAAADGEVSS